MRKMTSPRAPIAMLAAFALLLASATVHADERIEGTVVGAKLTYCDAAKHATCTGKLTLQRELGGKPQTRRGRR